MGTAKLNTSIHSDITNNVLNRLRIYDTHVVREFPGLMLVKEVVNLGSFSMTFRKSKRRYLRAESVIKWGQWYESPTTIARDYLTIKYGRATRCHVEQREALNKGRGRGMPRFADPGYIDNAVYVDIKSAWWEILLTIGWNTDYYPMRWWALGVPPDDFPLPDNKPARSSLVTIPLARDIRLWLPGHGVVKKGMRNKLINSHLFPAVCDVLHCVATEAFVKCASLRYFHTDGFIVHADDAKIMCDIIRSWGFTPRTKCRGAGWVSGPSSYRVGGKICKYENPIVHSLDYELMKPDEYKWVRDRWDDMREDYNRRYR